MNTSLIKVAHLIPIVAAVLNPDNDWISGNKPLFKIENINKAILIDALPDVLKCTEVNT